MILLTSLTSQKNFVKFILQYLNSAKYGQSGHLKNRHLKKKSITNL